MNTEQCYGIIVVNKDEDLKFLIVQLVDSDGSWGFPKGHHEGTETKLETAKREAFEEVGISDIKILETELIHEEYFINRNGEQVLKNNDYFIGFVDTKDVVIQEEEINDYRWATYEEALNLLQYDTRKVVLTKAKNILVDMVK